ncbi:TonB-dependent receptor plug domain-containing protein [Pseudoxanthomonas wuyuanensis]|uniref:Iron complex outermembrane recepter protein n=1 Tax=Pseudoxanthomonas wuyuanensis TaxID=1073196 RepID=A0A286D4G5_9GAMM|nr:TonB-dependent receptor [Pseudoxanthomonas wuyuanensis]KAF1719748.1 TonB-dependent receptor [Pseudoxanthomonas wuyuanensis]SOD53537.1 iron complex outermembrane recepter protein [Pseudoxanthomonas wuyuanensis]
MTRKPSPLAIAVVMALAASPALAQEGAKTLDTLIVTGTRVSDRTVAESTAPIDIITPENLASTGTVELATALSRAVPSLNFPRAAINDGTDAMRPAQLRGLAPDHTLVLVNGKRYHPGALVNVNGSQGRSSSPVDLNSIPISAIERVEVLRDGASAQYGSDAIAGVINIVLKGSDQGGSLSATYGQYSAGDGAQYQLLGDAGFKLGEVGKVHIAVQGGHQDQTDRARPFLGTVTPTSAPAGKVVQRYGDPEVDNGSFLYNGEVGITDYLTFYSYGLYTKRETLSNGFFRPAGDARNIPEIYPDGFLPQIFNTSTDVSVSSGIRTYTDGGTNIDISYTFGSSELEFDIRNTLNRSLGPTSPTQFYAGALEFKQHVLNFDFNKPLDWGLAYPLTLSYGAEWRGEKFTITPGEPGSYINGGATLPTTPPTPTAAGAQVFPGFRPSDSGSFDRNNISVYAGLEGDLTDKLSAGVAVRYEDYSDFGDTTTGKLTGRYAFNDAVALRATVSTGFHAPSLQQQYYQTTSTNFIGGEPFDLVTFRVTNPAGIALGAEPLKAEKSDNLSLGLVLTPMENLYVTIDGYRIKVKDRITLSENLISAPVREYLNENGFPTVSGGRYFTNALDTTTTGVDIIGTYTWNLAASKLDFTTGYNYNKTEIDRVAENPAALEAIDPDALRFGRVELGRFEVGAPRDKFFLNSIWTKGGFSVSATATRYGEFTIRNSNPALDQTFEPKWLLDLSFNYKLDNWDFTLGGDNVLNEYPDENIFATSTSGQLPYPSQSPFGFNGAYAYARIGYKW